MSRSRRDTRRRASAGTRIVVFGAVGATAAAGSTGTRPGSLWFKRLDKPPWQPPDAVFGPVWTALYVLIAWAAVRGLGRATPEGRRVIARWLGVDLALNAAWSWTFFTAQRTDAALAVIGLLDGANLGLLRARWRADRTAAVMLLPYVAWTAFATALTASLHVRNR